ncbi:hypothetical protein ACN28S_53005 [Cystobacter fuscus]
MHEAKETRIARYIGRGLNIWSNVHIADMAELYLLALEKAPAGSFYYVENGEARSETSPARSPAVSVSDQRNPCRPARP